jgi:hypothetical protein
MMAWSTASRMVFASLVVAFVATVRPAVGAEPSPDARRPIVKSELRVIVRSAGYVDALRRQAGERPAPQPIARPLAGDLWLICVIDRPRQINMLTDRDLDTLGLSQDEAIALGTQNVASPLPPGSAVITPLWPRNGIGYVTGHFYESSRLLLHEDWSALSQQMSGHLVVAVPVPEGVLYIEGKDPADLAALARVAEATAKDDPRKISTQLLRWVPDGWEVVNP